jgi:DNA mismatch endonuclease, patch repair protein
MKRGRVSRTYLTAPPGPSPAATSHKIARTMKSNRSSGTWPERALSEALGKPLQTSALPGKPEFVFRRARLTVFVHGDFWHRCPVCKIPLPKRHRSYWKRKLDRNVERDGLNRKELESMGWRVMEVWEHEIKADPQRVAVKIRRAADLGRGWAIRVVS